MEGRWKSEKEVMIFQLEREGELWRIKHFWDAEVLETGEIKVKNYNCRKPSILR